MLCYSADLIYLNITFVMATSVNISVEAIIENVIQEIAYDGTEVHQP